MRGLSRQVIHEGLSKDGGGGGGTIDGILRYITLVSRKMVVESCDINTDYQRPFVQRIIN